MRHPRLAAAALAVLLASPALAFADDDGPVTTRLPDPPPGAPQPAPEPAPQPEAAAPTEEPPPPPRPEAPQQVFISPAGEPFRAPRDQPYPVSSWFAGADADKDGRLTRPEFINDSLRFFDTLDADRNGVLDGFEIADYERKVAPEILPGAARGVTFDAAPGGRPRAAPARGQPRPYGQGRSGAGLYGLINEVQPVMAADSDIDRRVTRAEAEAAAKDRFRILDEDADGALTLETLPRTPLQRMLEGPPPR